MKKCPECGESGDDSSIFCQNCGNKLESIENRTVKNTPQVTDSSFEKIQTIKIFGYSIYFFLVPLYDNSIAGERISTTNTRLPEVVISPLTFTVAFSTPFMRLTSEFCRVNV